MTSELKLRNGGREELTWFAGEEAVDGALAGRCYLPSSVFPLFLLWSSFSLLFSFCFMGSFLFASLLFSLSLSLVWRRWRTGWTIPLCSSLRFFLSDRSLFPLFLSCPFLFSLCSLRFHPLFFPFCSLCFSVVSLGSVLSLYLYVFVFFVPGMWPFSGFYKARECPLFVPQDNEARSSVFEKKGD